MNNNCFYFCFYKSVLITTFVCSIGLSLCGNGKRYIRSVRNRNTLLLYDKYKYIYSIDV